MKRSKVKEKTFEEEIQHVLESLKGLKPETEEYHIAARNLEVLCKVNESSKLSMEVILGVVANIGGLLLVLNHERLYVISQKAFSWIWKARI